MKNSTHLSDNTWKETGIELGIYDLYMTSIIIGRVLHTFRDTLTYQQAAELITQLPDDVKVVFVSNWKLQPQKPQFRHLDEFVQRVLEEDSQHELQVFSSEVGALSAILTTMRLLGQFMDIDQSDLLSYSFKNELRLAVQEYAA